MNFKLFKKKDKPEGLDLTPKKTEEDKKCKYCQSKDLKQHHNSEIWFCKDCGKTTIFEE